MKIKVSNYVSQFLVDHGVMYEHTGRDGVTSYTCAYDHRIAYPVYNQYNELTAFSFRDDGYNKAQWNIAHEDASRQGRHHHLQYGEVAALR